MFVSMFGLATLSAYNAYATKQRVEQPATAGAPGPTAGATALARANDDRAGSSTTSAPSTDRATTTGGAAAHTSAIATPRARADADYRGTIDHKQRLGRELVIAGLVALVVACSGLLLVGARRRLW